MNDTEQKLKESLKGLIWLFETMMDAADIDLDKTEIVLKDADSDKQLGEKKSLNQILDKYRKEVE